MDATSVVTGLGTWALIGAAVWYFREARKHANREQRTRSRTERIREAEQDARRRAVQFALKIDQKSTLQLEIHGWGPDWCLRSPSITANPNEKPKMQVNFTDPVDAYRYAVKMAKSGGLKTLLLYVDGHKYGQRTSTGQDVNVIYCDMHERMCRYVKEMLMAPTTEPS